MYVKSSARMLPTLLLCCTALGAGRAWSKPPKPLKKPAKQTVGAKRARRAPQQANRVASPSAVRADQSSGLLYGQPIRYHNLTIVPVATQQQGPFQNYTLLEQGLKAGTLSVREVKGNSDAAQVNAVEVRNSGKLPVYLLGGEMILGGKQDRIISQDAVIDTKRSWVKVAVFCVEQGRWRGRNMRFRSGTALAHARLRRAAMSDSQGDVWAEVARKNLKHGTQSSTQTYRRTIQNSKLRSKIAPYRKALLDKLPGEMRLAGLIVAVNGRIRVADLFGNPVLFVKLRDKLLSAYILEALEEQVDPNAPVLSKSKAQKWLHKARGAKKRLRKKAGRAQIYRNETDESVGSETVDSKGGKTVRETYIIKQNKK